VPTNDEVLAMIADGGKLTAIADLTRVPRAVVEQWQNAQAGAA
jgi:hypothetical protein